MASAAPTIGVAQVDNLVAALRDHRAYMLRTGDQTVWNDTGRAAALAAHDLFEHHAIYTLAEEIGASIGVDIDGDPLRDDGFVSSVVTRSGRVSQVWA